MGKEHEKRIETCYAHGPTPHKECTISVLWTCINKTSEKNSSDLYTVICDAMQTEGLGKTDKWKSHVHNIGCFMFFREIKDTPFQITGNHEQ